MSSGFDASSLRIVKDATCTACGCLCDDIIVSATADQIVNAENACETGRHWFLADRARPNHAECWIGGKPSPREEAIAHAGQLLRSARSPLVFGLSQSVSEATAAALTLADRIGAIVDADLAGNATDRLRAFQRVGRVSATLGEVKQRADVVVFWGVDPVKTHPRHLERYSVDPVGRFVPRGRAQRTVIVVDEERTATADRGDVFVRIPNATRFEALWALRAIVKSVALDPDRVERSTGVALADLDRLATRLKAAHYGAWFFSAAHRGPAEEEAVLTLVRDLNAPKTMANRDPAGDIGGSCPPPLPPLPKGGSYLAPEEIDARTSHTRFVAITLGARGNPAGAEAVTTWQTGIPSRVDFSQRAPRFWPGETSAEAVLERQEADIAVVLTDDIPASWSSEARAQLGRIPRIAIGPNPDIQAAVALVSATMGIDAGGSVIRSDGVTLPLRPALNARFPTDREWLQMLIERLDSDTTP